MTFKSLQIIEPILKALEQKGYEHPTPIQAKAIPLVLSKRENLQRKWWQRSSFPQNSSPHKTITTTV